MSTADRSISSANLWVDYCRLDGSAGRFCLNKLVRDFLDGVWTPRTARLWYGRDEHDGWILAALTGGQWVLYWSDGGEFYQSFNLPSPFDPAGDYSAREIPPASAAAWLERNGHPLPSSLQGVDLGGPEATPSAVGAGVSAEPASRDVDAGKPKRKQRNYQRGELDDRATVEFLKNPSLTNEQIAAILKCHKKTLGNRRKCPKLAGVRARIKAERDRFRVPSSRMKRSREDDDQ